MRVLWSSPALQQVGDIGAYIAHDDAPAADRVITAIDAVVARIGRHPGLGRVGRVAGTRECIVVGTPYIIAYAVRGDCIDIVTVRHSSRDWPDYFEIGDDDA